MCSDPESDKGFWCFNCKCGEGAGARCKTTGKDISLTTRWENVLPKKSSSFQTLGIFPTTELVRSLCPLPPEPPGLWYRSASLLEWGQWGQVLTFFTMCLRLQAVSQRLSKCPKLGGLRWQTCILSQCWRLKVRSQGVGKALLLLKPARRSFLASSSCDGTGSPLWPLTCSCNTPVSTFSSQGGFVYASLCFCCSSKEPVILDLGLPYPLILTKYTGKDTVSK